MIATLGALVLSSLLAQVATPAPTAAAGAPLPSSAPAASATATDEYIRRPPETAPRMINAPHTAADATIVNSGSTNAAGYSIVVHPDYSADVTVAGSTERKKVAAPQARWLFAKLHAAMPLAALPGGRCMKSMSFGSSTTIAYADQTTPDLTCVGDATTRELGRIASVIVEQLNVPLRRGRGVEVR